MVEILLSCYYATKYNLLSPPTLTNAKYSAITRGYHVEQNKIFYHCRTIEVIERLDTIGSAVNRASGEFYGIINENCKGRKMTEQEKKILNERIDKKVQTAIDKVWGSNTRPNIGYIDNHSGEELADYFLKLADNDKDARAKQEAMLKKFEEEDFSEIDKRLRELNVL